MYLSKACRKSVYDKIFRSVS